jgi:aromatic ring hydroxylase
MAIRTGEQLLQSLRDGRQLFIDGDRVEASIKSDPPERKRTYRKPMAAGEPYRRPPVTTISI